MRELSGADTQMLYTGGRNTMNMFAPFGIWDPSVLPEGRLDFDAVLDYVQARIHLVPTFRERLAHSPLGVDRPSWINDAHFDLEYHVRELALPAPGTWKQLTTQVARIGARPLDMTRPPWELYVIHGLDAIDGLPTGSFATMLKVHHAAVDGVASAELVTSLLQFAPDAPPPPPPTTEWVPDDPPSTLSALASGLWKLGTRPLRDPRKVVGLVRSFPSVATEVFLKPSTGVRMMPSAATRFNAEVSPHRVWDLVDLPLAEIRQIRRAVRGATVNDVGLAIVGGALGRYLRHHGEAPEHGLTAAMPVSHRATRRQSSTDPRETGGNQFTVTFVPLGSDVADPLERLRLVHAATVGAKEHGNASGMHEFLDSAQLIPGSVVGTAQRAILGAFNQIGLSVGAHCIVTNVPAPPVPLYFCGAKALTLSGLGPVVDGMGLSITISGYLTDVSITWTADRAMMPDPEVFGECVRASYAELLAAAVP